MIISNCRIGVISRTSRGLEVLEKKDIKKLED